MSNLVTVEALDASFVGILLLLLRARLADVTHLIAIAALGNTTVDRFASLS